VGLGLRASRRLVTYVAISAALLAALLATPFMLLSDISQAYSATSVLLSSIALTGVAISLVYQAQQTMVIRDERDRATHREMIYLTMEDRALAACWEPPDIPRSHGRQNWSHTTFGSRRTRAAEFAEIVEERYQAAISAGPAVAADGYFDPNGPRLMTQ
jgi:hypothetical protein